MLALIAMAVFSGVTKGYEDLTDYAATLSQAQLRALRFRLHARTGRVRCPQRTSFQRVLTGVNAEILERVLLLWQEQVLGPVQDQLAILDGKELRHADVESVNAVSGTGRWLGSTKVKEGSNEIPAAREQLAKLDVVGKIVLADAAHTQVATAIESRLHHALDVTLGEDRSRVHNSRAAFALSLFRRVVVSFAQVWLEECRKTNPRSRATTRKFQKRFLHRNGGPARLQALIFSKSPNAWRLPK